MIKLISDDNKELLNNYNKLINIDVDFKLNPFLKLLIYIDNNNILGYLKYQYIYDRYEIDDLFVKEEYRNNKIASKLMEELINNSIKDKVLNITLEVKKDNLIAINLYSKYGFFKVAVRERYYNGVDGILMKKEL